MPDPTLDALNQCDGCQSGMPLEDGVHYRDGHPHIGCTKARYAPPTPTLDAPMTPTPWIEAVRDCIVAITDSLNRTEPLKRCRYAETALAEMTAALIAAGKEHHDA